MTSLLNTSLCTAEMCMQIRIPLAYFYYFFNSLSIQMKHNFLCTETSSVLFLCILWCRLSSNPCILWAVSYNEHCGPLSDRSVLYPSLMRQFPNYWANRQCFSRKFHPFKHGIPTGWLANYHTLNPSHTQTCGIYSWTSNFLFFLISSGCLLFFFFPVFSQCFINSPPQSNSAFSLFSSQRSPCYSYNNNTTGQQNGEVRLPGNAAC